MKLQRTIILVQALLGGGLHLHAQDPQLSQFYAAPLYLNPALTGNTHQDRLILNYRTQWVGLPKGFDTYAVSYDHRSALANSGFGLMVMHDVAGSNGLAFTQVSGAYSYEARIDNRSAFRAGLRMGYTMRSYDPNNFLFADQVIRDNAATSVEANLIERTAYFDMSAGGMYFNDRWWAGLSLSHLNRPEQSLTLSGNARLPVRTSLHTGYRMALDGQRVDRSASVLTVTTHYKAQGKWDQLDIGGYVEHEQVMGGIWYRGLPGLKAYAPGYPNDDAIVFLAGFTTENQWQFAYSYDMTISWLTPTSGGAHEISVTYEWPRKSKRRKARIVPCPKF